MQWNIKVLKKLIELIEKRLDNAKNDEEVYMLQDDLYTIKQMINMQEKREIYILPESKNYHMINQKRYNDNKQFLLDSSKENFQKLSSFKETSLSHIAYLPRKLSFNEMLAYVEKFLLSTNLRLYELYRYLLLYDKISIGRKYYIFGSTSIIEGIMNKIYSTGDTYIYSRFNGKLETAAILPHELAHASQFNPICEPERIQIMRYSAFSESYANFIEYLFMMFMEKSPFQKNSLDFNREVLSKFIYEASCNSLKDNIRIFNIKKTYSNLLAFYWISIYLENPNKAFEDIDWFNKNYGILTDEEIINNYGFVNLIDGTKEVINDYERKRKKL